jgi:hypothetical protein
LIVAGDVAFTEELARHMDAISKSALAFNLVACYELKHHGQAIVLPTRLLLLLSLICAPLRGEYPTQSKTNNR